MRKLIFTASFAFFISACSASSQNIATVVLPTSNRIIDVVQHRSDSHGCAELVVLQTYNAEGGLIDSKEGRATSLPCAVIVGVIDAGGEVGAAGLISRAISRNVKAASQASTSVEVNNSNVQSQGQRQGQHQVGSPAKPPSEGGGGHGNNGRGNGNEDGNNPGTEHHHNNGDNN